MYMTMARKQQTFECDIGVLLFQFAFRYVGYLSFIRHLLDFKLEQRGTNKEFMNYLSTVVLFQLHRMLYEK